MSVPSCASSCPHLHSAPLCPLHLPHAAVPSYRVPVLHLCLPAHLYLSPLCLPPFPCFLYTCSLPLCAVPFLLIAPPSKNYLCPLGILSSSTRSLTCISLLRPLFSLCLCLPLFSAAAPISCPPLQWIWCVLCWGAVPVASRPTGQI